MYRDLMGCFPVSGSEHDSMIPSVLQTDQTSQNVPNQPMPVGGGVGWTNPWWLAGPQLVISWFRPEREATWATWATSANRETLARMRGGRGVCQWWGVMTVVPVYCSQCPGVKVTQQSTTTTTTTSATLHHYPPPPPWVSTNKLHIQEIFSAGMKTLATGWLVQDQSLICIILLCKINWTLRREVSDNSATN